MSKKRPHSLPTVVELARQNSKLKEDMEESGLKTSAKLNKLLNQVDMFSNDCLNVLKWGTEERTPPYERSTVSRIETYLYDILERLRKLNLNPPYMPQIDHAMFRLQSKLTLLFNRERDYPSVDIKMSAQKTKLPPTKQIPWIQVRAYEEPDQTVADSADDPLFDRLLTRVWSSK